MKKKGFIERLTDEQIKNFIDAGYKSGGEHKRRNGYIDAVIDDGSGAYDSIFHLSLYEFDTSGTKASEDWVNYLYSIFGEEYKKAYKEYIFQKYSLLKTIDKE